MITCKLDLDFLELRAAPKEILRQIKRGTDGSEQSKDLQYVRFKILE